MLILAALLATPAAGPPSRLDFQLMITPACSAFADKADRACPLRQLRYLHPSDLDSLEEDFLPTLNARQRRRIARFDRGTQGCPLAGLSCPAQHSLAAVSKAGLLDAFVAFACHASV
ncbi:hypothetical protein BRX43_15750 [Sphingomonas sp. S-NIH.Pt15_0812]|nr:hypothetical protein BRX43_15750 [Sphingomonas sp. S-NIH.Pt15_0812]